MERLVGWGEVESGQQETVQAISHNSRLPIDLTESPSDTPVSDPCTACEQARNSSVVSGMPPSIPEIGIFCGICQDSAQWAGLPFVSGWTRITGIPRNPESGMPVLPL